MNERQFKIAIENSDQFKSYPTFKKGITMRHQNIMRLHDLYQQADRYGIGYLKQNQSIFDSDVKLINEILNNEK